MAAAIPAIFTAITSLGTTAAAGLGLSGAAAATAGTLAGVVGTGLLARGAVKGVTSMLTPGTPGTTTSSSKDKPPVINKPKVAPTPDDLTVKRKKQRVSQRKYGTAGRAGTMLTGGDDTKLG